MNYFLRLNPVLLAAFLSVGALRADNAPAEAPRSKLAVYVNPAMIPDSGFCNLFADRISRVDFLFYYEGSHPIRHLDRCTFTLDLPEGLHLRSEALWAGWGIFGGKQYEFRKEKVERDGAGYTRYFIPLPGNDGMARAEPAKGTGYTGKCNHQCKLFLEPAGALPETFTAYWKVEGGPAQAEGSFPVKLFRLSKDAPKPKRIFLLGLSAQVFPPWSDLAEVESAATLLKEAGITYVPSVNRSKLLENGMPDLWTRDGFKFTALLYEPWTAKQSERDSLPEVRDYLVGLDGERAKGYPAEKYHMRLYCPLSLSTPGRTGFESMKNKALKAASEGAEIIDWDLEPQTWTECFCDDCRKAFAAFSQLPEPEILKLKPADLVLAYPKEWYAFRSHQTAEIYRNLRKAIQAIHPEAKISANSLLVATEQNLGDLGWGLCSFAEDPRLLDQEVDFHTVDTLTGGAADPVFLDAVRRGTTKPLIGTAGCSYCVPYNHNYIAGRRMRADKEGLPLGYNRRGDLQRLGILSSAASGAIGIRVPLLVHNEVVDAEVAVKTEEAAADLAKVEDYYLDWKRDDKAIEVIDLTETPSPWLSDRSIVAGGPWRSYYDRFGGRAQFRVHTQGDEKVVSLFNWDPYQEKRWLVRLKNAPKDGLSVIDLIGGAPCVLEENSNNTDPSRWTREQLEKGVALRIPSAGYAIFRFGKPGSQGGKPLHRVSKSERGQTLKRAETLKPMAFDFWRTDQPVDLRTEALERMRRAVKYFPSGTIPEH